MKPCSIDTVFFYNLERIESDENVDLTVSGEYCEEGFFEIGSITHNGVAFNATDAERERITVHAQEHYAFSDLCREQMNKRNDFL